MWKKLTTVEGCHDGTIYSVDWYRDYIASGCSDNGIRIFQVDQEGNTNVLHVEKEAHSGDVNCVRFSPDGSILASVGDDGKLKIWSTLKIETKNIKKCSKYMF